MKKRTSRREKERYVMGIDGGATRSRALVAIAKGKIMLEIHGKPLNFHAIGKEKFVQHLRALIGTPLLKYRPNLIVFGLAGVNTPHDLTIYRDLIRKTVPAGTAFVVYNDTKIALEDACAASPRILIVSGTGSNVYGEAGGKSARSSGWDFLLADEGSAYYFGREAMRAAIRDFDGRAPKTILGNLLLRKTKYKTIPEFISHIYRVWADHPRLLKRYIASFAPLVDTAAKKGDRVAKGIIEESAEELFLAARAVIERLGVRNERVCIGYVGSNFKAPRLKALLTKKIKQIAPRALFISNVDPARGAKKLALTALKNIKN